MAKRRPTKPAPFTIAASGVPSQDSVGLLRSLPPDVRAEILTEMFSFVAGEFARLVMEHTKPAPSTRRRLQRTARRPTTGRRG